MRTQLATVNNSRMRFTAVFVRYGFKSGYKGYPIKTLLFEKVKGAEGKAKTDHIWFTTTKGFEKYEFTEGDVISFDARVKPYWKGYKGHRGDDDLPPVEKDYKLSHPNNIRTLAGNKQTDTKQLNLTL